MDLDYISQLMSVVLENDILSIMIPVYDFIVAVLTVTRGMQALKKMPRGTTFKDSLYHLLLEQGKLCIIELHLINAKKLTFKGILYFM